MVNRDDVDFELREIDERILDVLEDGRCTRKHLADLLDVGGEYVYQRVDLMAKLGLINIIHDGFYELADDAETGAERVREESFEEEEDVTGLPDRETTSVDKPEVSDAVDAVVMRVSDGWEDTDDRLEQRRAAARAVLQHAVDSGDAVGKTDAIDEYRAEHHVDGQNEETWWRKNIRPVLKAVGEYSKSRKGYVVDDLDDQ